MFNIVIFNLKNPDIKVIIHSTNNEKHAKQIAKLFCKSKDWKIDRRPGLHTWDNVAVTVEKE